MMILFSLLTLGCSNDDESILAPNLNVKEIAITEAQSIDRKSTNVESEKSSVATIFCVATGIGPTPDSARINEKDNFGETVILGVY